jgi:hypothetical protein
VNRAQPSRYEEFLNRTLESWDIMRKINLQQIYLEEYDISQLSSVLGLVRWHMGLAGIIWCRVGGCWGCDYASCREHWGKLVMVANPIGLAILFAFSRISRD